jgi:hypothetical protein
MAARPSRCSSGRHGGRDRDMPQRSPILRSTAGNLAVLALVWLGHLLGTASCRAEIRTHYFADRRFEIPFEMSPGRPVKQVLLHASADGRTYSQVATAAPRDTRFEYTAAGDGWYYFVVQTEDLDGRRSPPNVALATPGLRVCIDTVRPQVALRAVEPREGAVAVEWEVSDKYIDLRTLKLEYRPAGTERWIALNIRHMERAQFDWNPTGTGPFDVRLHVSDLAGNTAVATTKVTATPGRTGAGAGGGTLPGQPRVIFVRSKTFRLNYEIEGIGPSNVKNVEVWMTRDTRVWQQYRTDAPARGPYELSVIAQGRYGFTLRPISGVGRGPAQPSVGQLPQIWVHVDEKAPVVKLHSIVVGEGADAGTMTINWRADDDYLRAQPITILYAEKPDGPWQELRKDVENTGTVKVPTKDLPFQFHVKVEAADEAGNKGSDVSRDTVKVDLSTPKIKHIDVDVSGGSATRPPVAPGGPGGP